MAAINILTSLRPRGSSRGRSKPFLSKQNGLGALAIVLGLCETEAYGQDATWLLSPGSSDWDTAANWAPAAVPTSTATFGASNTTTITFSSATFIGTIQLNAGAPTYTFDIGPNFLEIDGTGIVNNSSNRLTLSNSGPEGTFFVNASTAGDTIINNTSTGFTEFAGTSTAGTALITNSTGATTFFVETSTAGAATITTNSGSFTEFNDASTAGDATVITNSGGTTLFQNTASGAQAQFITNAGGVFDISVLSAGGTGVGSIAGAGNYNLGSKTLTVGSNNLSTDVSGVIADGGFGGGTGGSLVKVGPGTLTLSGNNIYTGGTTISAGTLQLGDGGTAGSIMGDVIDNAVFAFDRSDDVNFGGVISGSGALKQIGSGALTLAGANTYTGGTSLNFGSLIIGDNRALGTGALAMAAGTTLSFLGTSNFTVANNIQITGTANFAPPSGTIQTLAGNISNGASVGTFDLSGLGTLVLSGSSAYTGPTNVNAGVLQGGAANAFAPSSAFTVASGATLDLGGFNQAIGSLAGAGVVTNSGGSLATLTEGGNNASTEFSGVIKDDGPTGLTKIGAGTLTLSGTNTYTGPTDINAGILQVTGSIATSSLTTVMGGATLTGAGAVGATTVNSGGVFAPGSGAPGSSVKVLGALAFNAGATYQVQVNPVTASLANVTGAASLAGNVLADFAPGSYMVRKYTILTTTGGLGGTTFAGLSEVDPPAGFAETLVYDSNNVYLDLEATLGAVLGLNVNQQNVANALDNAFNGGEALPPNFVNLFGLTGGALTNALTQVSGEASTGARQTGFLFNDMFLSLMLDPYTENRGGGAGQAGSFGAAPGCASENEAQSALAPLPTKKPSAVPATSCGPHWTVWGAGFGGAEQLSGADAIGSHNASTRAGGFAAGADYHISPEAMLGFALAGGATNWSLSDALGGGHSNVFGAGLYGSRAFGAAYVAGALSFGENWVTSSRTVAVAGGGPLNASFNAQGFGGRIEAGYHALLAPLVLTPYAALQAQSFDEPSYVESTPVGAPSFALNYASKTATDTRFELGAWVGKTIAYPDGSALNLFGRLAWAHDWQGDPDLTATFQSLPAASFVVNGAKPAPDQALITTGAEWRFAKNWTLMAKFDGEFGSGSETYAATGRLAYNW
jgi:autotransporter-associated beta strand protein